MTGMLTIALLGTLSLSVQPAAADTPLPPVALADQEDDSEGGDEDDSLDYGGDDINLDVFGEALDLEEGDEEIKRMQQEDALDAEEGSEEALDDLEFGGDDDEDEFLFEDEEESVPIGGPGQDTARIYREYKENIEDLGPDEEIIQWEQYLSQYPNTLFGDHIQRRIDDLTEFQYSERVPDDLDGFTDIVDAGRREIKLATPRHLTPIDPRNKVRAGFEWGFPEYMNLFADYEAQIQRKWSWHVGVMHRYTGWNIEGGTKYALVKSARTNFIVTGIFDVHLNADPIFPALRPQLGVGKRFIVGGQPLDLQVVGGVDAELRLSEQMALVYIGGFNGTYQASEKVAFFVESSIVAKDMFWDAGINSGYFRFPLFTFGITFWAGEKNNITSSIAANAPYAYNYWGYHFGGVMGDFNMYRD
jgi:hypothetical protein